MKIYDTKIKDIILKIIADNTQLILWEPEQFEEIINEYSVHYCDECYLINKAVKMGLFETLLLNRHVPYEFQVELLKSTGLFDENEALFIVSVVDRVIKDNEWFIHIIDIDETVEKALEEGRPRDLRVAALSYYDGSGTTQDYEKAYDLFYKAYEYGDESACYYLGFMNLNGLGTEEDREKAIAFFEEGAKLDLPDCKYAYARLTKNMDLRESEDPRAFYVLGMQEYRAGNFKKAYSFFYKGANYFDANCLYMLGELSLIEENVDEGIKYLAYAYYLFSKQAAYSLGMLYIEGDFVKKNVAKAAMFLTQAERLGHPMAKEFLDRFRGEKNEDL